MKVLSRTVTVRQLALVSVVALTVGIGGSAVASNLSEKQAEAAPRANLGSVGGLNYRSITSNIPGNAQSSVIAHCPNSKHATGGGVLASGLFNSGAVNSSLPYDDSDAGVTPDDGWRAYVDNYSAGQQSVTVYAICK